jgi:hypothetical protein
VAVLCNFKTGLSLYVLVLGLKLLCCDFQALQLGQDANTPFGFFNGQRCQMCLRSDPLLKVMERLANPGESAGTWRLLVLLPPEPEPEE